MRLKPFFIFMKKFPLVACLAVMPFIPITAQTTIGDHLDNAGDKFDQDLTFVEEKAVDPVLETVTSNQSSEVAAEEIIPISTADNTSYQQGMLDAQRMYPARNTGAGGTFCTSLFLSPVFGLVPAFICSSNPPKTTNLGVMDADKLNDEEYMRGYTEEAYKIKKKKVWIGYGGGSAAYLAIIALYYSMD